MGITVSLHATRDPFVARVAESETGDVAWLSIENACGEVVFHAPLNRAGALRRAADAINEALGYAAPEVSVESKEAAE